MARRSVSCLVIRILKLHQDDFQMQKMQKLLETASDTLKGVKEKVDIIDEEMVRRRGELFSARILLQ